MQQGMSWYKRFPRDFLDGVQGLGPELIGAYAVLLDLIYARGGETIRDDRHLSGVMGCTKRKAESLTDRLVELGKLEAQGEFLTNSRAKTSAKLARNLTETRASAGRAGGIASGVSRKNKALAEATGESKNEQDKRREEIEKNPPLSPPGETAELPLDGDGNDRGSDPPQKKRTRGTRLPDDWKLAQSWGAEALALEKDGVRLSESEIRWEADQFRDYWQTAPGSKGVKLDWKKVWMNWCRRKLTEKAERASRSATRRFNGSGSNHGEGLLDRRAREAKEREREGQ